MRYVSRDPYWLTVKYAATCKRCKVHILPGARAFYYPKTKTFYCAGQCGDDATADFQACCEAEY
jgi:hypothetical protein